MPGTSFDVIGLKKISNTTCIALSIHVVDMHSCTGISLQWDLSEHLLGEYLAYFAGNGMASKIK